MEEKEEDCFKMLNAFYTMKRQNLFLLYGFLIALLFITLSFHWILYVMFISGWVLNYGYCLFFIRKLSKKIKDRREHDIFIKGKKVNGI